VTVLRNQETLNKIKIVTDTDLPQRGDCANQDFCAHVTSCLVCWGLPIWMTQNQSKAALYANVAQA